MISSGSPIAGESYSLECSAGESTTTFQWMGPPDGRTPIANSAGAIAVISTSSTSHLQFKPIQQSYSGLYSCQATTDGGALSSDPIEISVPSKINVVFSSIIILI